MKREKEEGETSGGEADSKKKETNGKETVNVIIVFFSKHWGNPKTECRNQSSISQIRWYQRFKNKSFYSLFFGCVYNI